MTSLASELILSLVGESTPLDYAFTEDGKIDADPRYERDTIASAGALNHDDPSKNTFTILSSELHGEQHKIRTPAQQAQWTEKKSICQQNLASEILNFRSSWEYLIDACDGKTEHMLGHIKTDEHNTQICYELKLHKQVAQLARDYLDGKSKFSKKELITLIVVDYNLSYCHFTKDVAQQLIDRFSVADKARKLHAATSASLKMQNDLFDVCEEVIEFENKEDVTWEYARTTILHCRAISTRIRQLRNLLVSTNFRGCLKHAISYFFSGGGNKQSSLDQMDLFSEGVEGLMHASDMFVHGTSARFSTYAEYWIKLKISRYIKNNYSVKIPIHVNDLIGKILRCFKESVNDNGQPVHLSKDAVQDIIKENIPDPVWRLALHRKSNTPYSISCSNTDSGDGSANFDMFSEVEIDGEEVQISTEAQRIIEIARSIVTPGVTRIRPSSGDRAPAITQQQFDIFFMKYYQDKPHAEIAETLGGNLTTKSIRREAEFAMTEVRRKLNIKVEEA